MRYFMQKKTLFLQKTASVAIIVEIQRHTHNNSVMNSYYKQKLFECTLTMQYSISRNEFIYINVVYDNIFRTVNSACKKFNAAPQIMYMHYHM